MTDEKMGKISDNVLVYPTAVRTQRLRIGGILYIIIGGILIGVAWLTGEGMFNFFGGIIALGGFFASGYRNQTMIHPEIGVINTLKGFFFFLHRCSYQRSEFQKVVVRKSKRISSRFSHYTNRRYERTAKTIYEVMLSGIKEVKVDSTEDLKAAEEWAQQIGNALNLSVGQEEESKGIQ